MLVDGKLVGKNIKGKRISVINPADEKRFATVPKGTKKHINKAVAAAVVPYHRHKAALQARETPLFKNTWIVRASRLVLRDVDAKRFGNTPTSHNFHADVVELVYTADLKSAAPQMAYGFKSRRPHQIHFLMLAGFESPNSILSDCHLCK